MLSDMKPFRMIGNTYFAGCRKYSCHVIDTGEGLIMIDTGCQEQADAIVDSLNILGFDVKDVKIIIHSHGHADHTDGSVKIKALSGAKTYLNKRDLRYIKEELVIDNDIKDGDIIKLGNTDIYCLETPGHTKGTVSLFWNVEENGKIYRCGTFGGAGTNQLKKPYLDNKGLAYFVRQEFFESLDKLRKEKVDVLIGNHPWHNNTFGKYEQSLTSDVNPFIDPTEWGRFMDKLENDLKNVIKEETKTLFVNYAHRGASEYTPENTMLAFNVGIFMGANGIETDVQLTKDNVMVLFHDDTLTRVTGQEGKISDYTYDELQEFLVTKNEFSDKILKFEDFLKTFAFRDLTFAVELKKPGTHKIAADLIRKYGAEKKVVMTSFDFDEICKLKEYAPELKAGFLTKDTSSELLQKLKDNGIDEYCPEAQFATKESVEKWHYMGFRVRAWGVYNEALMKSVYEAGVDGMTVNFPDKLAELIKSEGE